MYVALAILAWGWIEYVSRDKRNESGDAIIRFLMCILIFMFGAISLHKVASQGKSRVITSDESGYFTTEVDGETEYWRKVTPDELSALTESKSDEGE